LDVLSFTTQINHPVAGRMGVGRILNSLTQVREVWNWQISRAVLSISVTGDPKRFLLRAPKRGRKIGWSDDHGNKVTEIPIKHTDGAFPYWEKEIPRFRDPAQVSESNLSLKGEDLLTILPSGGLRTNEWRDKVVEKYGTSPSTFKRRFKELRDSERIQFDEESNCWKKNKKD